MRHLPSDVQDLGVREARLLPEGSTHSEGVLAWPGESASGSQRWLGCRRVRDAQAVSRLEVFVRFGRRRLRQGSYARRISELTRMLINSRTQISLHALACFILVLCKAPSGFAAAQPAHASGAKRCGVRTILVEG